MTDFFDNVERQEVYFKYGKTSNGKQRYRKAPFNIVKINGEDHIEIFSGNGETGTDLPGNETGYITEMPLIMEEHEMGDLSDTETFKGVHDYGWI